MLEQYDNIIRNPTISNFIESKPVNHNTGHNLPHHALKKDSVTILIRVVFSSWAAKGASSLDNYLYTEFT